MALPLLSRLILLLLVINGSSGVTVTLSGSSNYAVLGQTFKFSCTVTNEDFISLGTVGFAKSGGAAVCTVIPSSCTEASSTGYSCGCVGGVSNVYYMDIPSVSLQDEATWICTRRSVNSNSIALPVYYGPGQVALDKSSPQTVAESTTLTVGCSTSCKPCSYVWKKGTSTASSSRTLRMTNINRNQAGDYVCTATNTATGTSATSQTLTVVVQYRPEVRLETPPGTSSCRPYRVYVGQQNVLLTCRVTAANPAVTSYIWTHNGSTILSATSSVYTMSSVSRSSGGSYTCAGRNSLGDSSSSSLQVNVQHAPLVHLPSSRNVIEGQKLTLTCSVDTEPAASVSWARKDGSSFTPQTGFTLSIPNTQRSQTGVYVCTATNILSPCSGAAPPSIPVSREVTINVLYGPSVNLPAYYNVTEFSDLQFHCDAYTVHGNPQTTSYNWSGPGCYSSNVPVLSITSTNRNKSGQYTCTVSNTLTPTDGSAVTASGSSSIMIVVQYGPTISSSTFPPSYTAYVSSPVHIDCASHTSPGIPSTTSYRWTGPNSFSSNGPVLSISGITKSQAGVYTCTVTNILTPTGGPQEIGSDSKQVNVHVQVSDRSSSRPVLCQRADANSDDLYSQLLTCEIERAKAETERARMEKEQAKAELDKIKLEKQKIQLQIKLMEIELKQSGRNITDS